MEVVGVVLAGVSLLATIAENYEALYQLFDTYRHYVKEVDHFTTLLQTEKCIYQNECKSLLFEMKRDGTEFHDISGKDLRDGLVEMLGPSYNALESILILINETLEKVSRETKSFYSPSQQVNYRSHFCR